MKKTNSLYVSSPVNALVKGILREDKTLKEVLEHGDFGLGTFNDLDGEMVLLDGVFYDLHSDWNTNIADINLETPYACVTHFRPKTSTFVNEELTFDSLKKKINSLFVGLKSFYTIFWKRFSRVTNNFNRLNNIMNY